MFWRVLSVEPPPQPPSLLEPLCPCPPTPASWLGRLCSRGLVSVSLPGVAGPALALRGQSCPCMGLSRMQGCSGSSAPTVPRGLRGSCKLLVGTGPSLSSQDLMHL